MWKALIHGLAVAFVVLMILLWLSMKFGHKVLMTEGHQPGERHAEETVRRYAASRPQYPRDALVSLLGGNRQHGAGEEHLHRQERL